MSKIRFIRRFEPLTKETLFDRALESIRWIEQYNHSIEDAEYWDVQPGKEIPAGALLLNDTSIYAGSAGVALLYLRAYRTTGDIKWLNKAKAGINHVINTYKGVDEYKTDSEFLPGAFIGFLQGPSGGAYVARLIYDITKEERYKEFAIRVANDTIEAAHEENGALTWYGFYGILGEGGLILFLLDIYAAFGEAKHLDAARQAAQFIVNHKEDSPYGGYRWYVMPTDTFPTIGKAGGYFPGFEYGAAGCGYILAKAYEATKDEEFLKLAKGAAEYIINVADYSEDGEAALVKYNDTYLTDLYYLGVCQGPVGTSRLFYELYSITGDENYKNFIIKLTKGLLATGAPSKHSEGYWRTNCYCCGAAGMLEHFIYIHKLTGDSEYLDAAIEAAETLIGESTVKNNIRNWYTAWNRHEPHTSDAYTGLYHGTGGCAGSLLALSQYLKENSFGPSYLEDPYQKLFE